MVCAEEAAFEQIGPWREDVDYRAALILPFDLAGRVLLQLRDHNPAAANPGKWGLFGGEVEPGESLAMAAAREFEEETGIARPEADFTPWVRMVSPRSGKRGYVFTISLDITPRDIRLGEGAGFGFIEPRDYAKLDAEPFARTVLAYRLEEG